MIRTYQKLLSPLLGQHCRFYPSCSQYTLEAIEEWGLVKGVWLGTKRICRCHPLNEGGIDPIPRRSDIPSSTSANTYSTSTQVSSRSQDSSRLNADQTVNDALAPDSKPSHLTNADESAQEKKS